jgi:very-short-patch-repair endonuclease
MKKYPTIGAHDRARALRRNVTEAEQRLWKLLGSRRMMGCKFRRQVPIGHYIVDFLCHETRLIIEVDGGQHDLSSEQETNRTAFLQSQGYRVLRFWNDEVMTNPEGVYSLIAESLSDHPHPNPPPSRATAFTHLKICRSRNDFGMRHHIAHRERLQGDRGLLENTDGNGQQRMDTDERRRQSSRASDDRTAPKGGKMPAAHPQSVFIRCDPFPSVFL